MVDIEDLNEKELGQLYDYYVRIAELSKNAENIHKCYSLDATEKKHKTKYEGQEL